MTALYVRTVEPCPLGGEWCARASGWCGGCKGDGTRAIYTPAPDGTVHAIVKALRLGLELSDAHTEPGYTPGPSHAAFTAALATLGVEP